MPTPSLRELQRLFWHALADDPVAAAAAPDLLTAVEPSATLAAGARLRIYADAYFWRLRDVLTEDFPQVARLLGPERFEDVARHYVRSHPSEDPSVRHLGRDMAAFLRRRSDLPPYLGDLAQLEWARQEVFDAPDAAPLTLAALRRVALEDWPRLRLRPSPALAVVRATWPVHHLRAEGDPAALEAAPTVLRVWRAEDGAVYHAPLDARAADALDRLLAGEPFASLCAAFADLPPDEAAREATALLLRWIEDGIIAGADRPAAGKRPCAPHVHRAVQAARKPRRTGPKACVLAGR